MPGIELNEVRQDCVYFRGGIPCQPNKTRGVVCTCDSYRPISKRILIIKLGALGDVIRTTPLIGKYRQLYPDCHITWLTQSPEVLPKDSINVILKPDAFSIWTIQQSEYDIAINLDKENEACMLLAAAKAPEKYGYTWTDNKLAPATPAAVHKLMTGFFDELSQRNTKSYLEEIFEICHMEFSYEPYQINKNHELCAKWYTKLREISGGRPIIGLNTGCGPRWNTRLWPVAYWEELAATLKSQGYFPAFLGGALEHEKNTAMAANTGTHYPGHYSLEEFIALTDSCDLILTQVSMMMHIATALEKKMVLMNNIFNRHEFELYGRGEIIEPRSNCECYYGNTCKRGESSCMHDLTAAEVAAAIVRVVSKPAA